MNFKKEELNIKIEGHIRLQIDWLILCNERFVSKAIQAFGTTPSQQCVIFFVTIYQDGMYNNNNSKVNNFCNVRRCFFVIYVYIK